MPVCPVNSENSVGGVKMGCLSLAKSASTFLVVKGFVVTGLVALY